MSAKLTRRDFLKLAGTALGGLAFSPYIKSAGQFDDSQLVRVGIAQVSVYHLPADDSRIVRQVFRDDILHIYEEVTAPTPAWNPVWYRVWGGYVNRAHMQKVQVIYNQPAKSIRETKQLAEVTVPYSQPLRLINKVWQPIQDWLLYYGTVHWVIGVLEEGPDGQPWYTVQDQLLPITYIVPATHLRLIPDEEIAPISPEVPFENKRIEVSLYDPTSAQTLTCYEYDKVVLHTTISSGLPTPNLGANGISTLTPTGDKRIEVKMPSKHMGNGSLEAGIDSYELLGVPWCSFFTDQGHAFHGTYWHDNFGNQMSHGCINMRTEEAKWLFRWCLPPAPADQITPLTLDKKGYGTPVKIKS